MDEKVCISPGYIGCRDAPPRRSSCGVSTISSCTIVELEQFTQVSMLIIVVLIIVFVYRTQPCGNSENRHQTAGYNLLWMLSGINTEMSLEDGSRVASTVSSGHEDAPSDWKTKVFIELSRNCGRPSGHPLRCRRSFLKTALTAY